MSRPKFASEASLQPNSEAGTGNKTWKGNRQWKEPLFLRCLFWAGSLGLWSDVSLVTPWNGIGRFQRVGEEDKDQPGIVVRYDSQRFGGPQGRQGSRPSRGEKGCWRARVSYPGRLQRGLPGSKQWTSFPWPTYDVHNHLRCLEGSKPTQPCGHADLTAPPILCFNKENPLKEINVNSVRHVYVCATFSFISCDVT